MCFLKSLRVWCRIGNNIISAKCSFAFSRELLFLAISREMLFLAISRGTLKTAFLLKLLKTALLLNRCSPWWWKVLGWLVSEHCHSHFYINSTCVSLIYLFQLKFTDDDSCPHKLLFKNNANILGRYLLISISLTLYASHHYLPLLPKVPTFSTVQTICNQLRTIIISEF